MNWKHVAIVMAVASAPFALFWWIIWNFIWSFGLPSSVSEIMLIPIVGSMREDMIWHLPFSVSHYWCDPVFAPLILMIWVWLIGKTEIKSDEDNAIGTGGIYGLLLGTICGMMTVIFGLIISLAVGAIVCFLYVFYYFRKTDCSFSVSIFAVAGISLGFIFGNGIIWTMPVGIMMGVIIVLPSVLIPAVSVIVSISRIFFWDQLCPEDKGWD